MFDSLYIVIGITMRLHENFTYCASSLSADTATAKHGISWKASNSLLSFIHMKDIFKKIICVCSLL